MSLKCPRCHLKITPVVPLYKKATQTVLLRLFKSNKLSPLKTTLRKIYPLQQVKNTFYDQCGIYNYQDLFFDSLEFAKKIPRNFDCVIGVPRQGLIVASVLSSVLGLPLSTPDSFINGIIWHSRSVALGKIVSVLVVDETVDSGRNMSLAVNKLQYSIFSSFLNISTAALVRNEGSKFPVDFCYKTIPRNTVCEWDLKFEGEIKVCL